MRYLHVMSRPKVIDHEHDTVWTEAYVDSAVSMTTSGVQSLNSICGLLIIPNNLCSSVYYHRVTGCMHACHRLVILLKLLERLVIMSSIYPPHPPQMMYIWVHKVDAQRDGFN